MKNLPLVEVTWDDAAGFSQWQRLEDFISEASPYRVRSIGYLVEKTDKYLLLVGDLCEEAETVHHAHLIPAGMVV